MDARLANDITEGNLIVEESQIKDEVQSVGQTTVDIGPSVNLTEVNVDGELLDEFQTAVRAGSTGNIAEGAITRKRRKKRKRIARADEAELQCEMDARNIAEGSLIVKKPKINDEVLKSGLTRIHLGSTKVPAEGIVNIGNAEIQDETESMYKAILDNGQAQSFILRPAARKRKKKRKGKKTKLEHEVQKEMNAKDELQSLGLIQMNTGSLENLADGNVITKNPNTPVEAQSLEQNTTEMWQLEENLAQGCVAGKRRKKRNKKKAKVNDKVHNEMDTRLTENLAGGNSTLSKPEINDVLQSVPQTRVVTGLTDDIAGGYVTVKRARCKKRRKKAKGKDEFSSRIDAGSTANLDEVNVNIRTPENRDEVQCRGLKVMDAESTENLMKGSLTSENPEKNDEGQTKDSGPSEDYAKAGKKKKTQRIHAEGNVTIENQKVQDESIDQAQMNTPTQDLAEGNVIVNRKKKRKRNKKVKVKDDFSGIMNAKSTEKLVIVDEKYRISETADEVSGGLKVMGAGSSENLTKGSLTFENQKSKDEGPSTDMVKINTEPAIFFSKARKRKKKRKSTRKPNIASELCVSTGAVKGLSQVSDVSVGRKLLVLDVNGLLADVVFPAPKGCKGDIKLYGRAVFRRPFCDDFLQFCFQNFYVGIWSSRSKKVVDKVVSYLLGDQVDKLLFCWDMAHTTKTGFNTLENRHKPLVCKDLRKIWEEDDPSWPWKKGDINESKTLLLDDSPYKALLNPLHTSIFPHPYRYSDKYDNSLGPGGDLRVYLEGLAASDNVQKYVEQNPFGQSPITEQDVHWEFYDRVLKNIEFAQQ